jgi:hypothetical protein
MTREQALQLWKNHFGNQLQITESEDGRVAFEVRQQAVCIVKMSGEQLDPTTLEIQSHTIYQVEEALKRYLLQSMCLERSGLPHFEILRLLAEAKSLTKNTKIHDLIDQATKEISALPLLAYSKVHVRSGP